MRKKAAIKLNYDVCSIVFQAAELETHRPLALVSESGCD
jgi:hypothetical protein